MPARKGSIDGNFVTKATNYINGLGKRIWYSKREDKVPYIAILSLLSFFYLKNGMENDAWTPREIFENIRIEEKEKTQRRENEKKTVIEYNELFKDAKTFDDSLMIYNNNPVLKKKIRLKQVYTVGEMEEAVKKNKLESKL